MVPGYVPLQRNAEFLEEIHVLSERITTIITFQLTLFVQECISTVKVFRIFDKAECAKEPIYFVYLD